MTATWYKASTWSYLQSPIVPVQVVKVSAYWVTILETGYTSKPRERRTARSSRDCAYFLTYAEAKEWLIANAKQGVEWAQQDLERKQANLAKLLALPAEPPKEG